MVWPLTVTVPPDIGSPALVSVAACRIPVMSNCEALVAGFGSWACSPMPVEANTTRATSAARGQSVERFRSVDLRIMTLPLFWMNKNSASHPKNDCSRNVTVPGEQRQPVKRRVRGRNSGGGSAGNQGGAEAGGRKNGRLVRGGRVRQTKTSAL